MSKVIPDESYTNYCSGEFNTVGGFTTEEAYVVRFTDPKTIFHETGMGYNGSPFSPDQDFVYSMRYTTSDVNKFVITYEGNLDNLGKDHESPSRLNGSVGDSQAKFYTPEWCIDGYASIESGEIYKIYADGTEEMVAVYDPEAQGAIPGQKGRFVIISEID